MHDLDCIVIYLVAALIISWIAAFGLVLPWHVDKDDDDPDDGQIIR